MIGRIDHVGIAVASIAEARKTYEALGLHVEAIEEVPHEGVRVALIPCGESRIELLEPLGPDSSIAKFLAKRGPGLHHVAYQTTDIEAALQALKDAGMRLIDESPRIGIRNSKVAFLHPGATNGVLTEIVQPAEDAH